ncbi:MAG: hypothetical protein WA915_15470, partial [Candidatus Aminicenantaceae bacterium]
MLTILPYLLQGYGRSKCTLLLCPKFGERFKDLTYDNLENQIILRATNLLAPLISQYNDKI